MTNLNSTDSGKALIQKVINKTKTNGKNWSKQQLVNLDSFQKNSNVPQTRMTDE
jgi:hypothetical protein